MDNNQPQPKKTAFSAIKPTGAFTLGNYIGALKNWLFMQEEYHCYYAVADLHAITVDIPAPELRSNTLDAFASLLAVGLDPKKSILFVQSHVPQHSELTWVLNCYTQFGEARRMTQFKDKSLTAPQNINVGLFDYPVLMAADILLYGADFVPIGKDQKQHLELSRTIAERFNGRYSPTFTVPEGFFPKYGAKVFSLSDPLKKMGKTDEFSEGCIFIQDTPEVIRRKFKRAVTDSETEIRYDAVKKPGVTNLLTIYAICTDKEVKGIEKEFSGKNYAQLKEIVADAVIGKLAPMQKTFKEVRGDKTLLTSLMKEGAQMAERNARKMLSKVYRKIGFVEKP